MKENDTERFTVKNQKDILEKQCWSVNVNISKTKNINRLNKNIDIDINYIDTLGQSTNDANAKRNLPLGEGGVLKISELSINSRS